MMCKNNNENKKMTKRFMNLSLPKKTDKYEYIIDKYNSKHFQDIENKWKVYIPLNIADLEDYNDWNRTTKWTFFEHIKKIKEKIVCYAIGGTAMMFLELNKQQKI